MMTANRERPNDFVHSCEPEPEEMITKCLLMGECIFVGWLFHRAYIASVVAQSRDGFLARLRAQDVNVQELVYTKWHERLARTEKGDPTQILQHGETAAFRALQRLTQISLRYIGCARCYDTSV